MNRLTASGLSRGSECLGSVLLPGIPEGGRWAGIGNAVDRFVQVAKTKSREVALVEAAVELRPYLAALTIERIPDGAEYQVAFALNALTGEVRRISGRSEGYPEDLGDEWIFGTSDIVGVRGARAIVWDIKWGTHTIGRDPATDLQLGFYGICATSIAQVDEVELAFARAGWDGELRPESAVLDAFDLSEMRERIVALWKSTRTNQALRLRVGEWCGYCPARRNCDAMVQPTAMMLRGDVATLASEPAPTLETMKERLSALTPEQRGRVFEVCDEIEDRAKLLKQIIRDDARQAPIPLSGGKELREVMWGARKASPEAKEREDALEAELRAEGLVRTVKVPQVRPMAVRRPR